jgi:protein O-mannosyl-transferase
LTSFYGRSPHVVLNTKLVYAAWIIPAALLFALMLIRKRKRVLIGCPSVFAIALLPVLGFTPFMYQLYSTVADHYLYLSMFGAALAAAVVVSMRPTRGVLIACCVVLALLDARSILQIRHWRDDVAWASHGVALYPQNFHAHASLGSALASAGQVEQAIPHFQFCVDESPQSPLAQQRLAQALVYTSRFEQAIPHAQAALDLAGASGTSDLAWEHFLLGKALSGAGQTEAGQRHLDIAIRLRPSLATPATTQ